MIVGETSFLRCFFPLLVVADSTDFMDLDEALSATAPQHALYFFLDPHGHILFRETFFSSLKDLLPRPACLTLVDDSSKMSELCSCASCEGELSGFSHCHDYLSEKAHHRFQVKFALLSKTLLQH